MPVSAGAVKMISRLTAAPPGDAYFVYPYMPLLPFLVDREHVSKYDILIPGYTLPSQYHDACLSVMREAEWLVINRSLVDPKKWMEAFPAMQNAQPRETVEFEKALERGFEFVARDEPFELRRRHKDASEAICIGSAD